MLTVGGPRMAKKKAGKHASELRRGWKSVADLREDAESVKQIMESIESIAEIMEREGVPRIYMDGVKKIDAGMKELRGYVKNIRKAYIDAQGG